MPVGTDTGLIIRLNTEFNEAIKDQATKQGLAEIRALTKANAVAQFATFREQQIEFFTEMVKSANIRFECKEPRGPLLLNETPALNR